MDVPLIPEARSHGFGLDVDGNADVVSTAGARLSTNDAAVQRFAR